MKRRIDQLLAGYAAGDAISQESRIFREILRDAGYDSEIFVPAGRIAPDMRHDCRPLGEFNGERCETVILHYSTCSDADPVYAAFRGRRIMRYHNITPSAWFAGYDDTVAAELAAARAQLPQTVAASDCCWSDSAYNAAELEEFNPPGSIVLPLMFSPDEFIAGSGDEPHPEFSDSLTNLLFVGRIAPNKCIEDLIETFAYYRTLNPLSRLIIVGSAGSCPAYYAMLRLLASRLKLDNVCFTGFVTNSERYRIYRSAHIFVTASRHEGYCLPLVEAMARGVPAIAGNRGGMPEAMGGGGILYEGLTARELAVLIDRVLKDNVLREEIMTSQQKRLEEINRRNPAAELTALL